MRINFFCVRKPIFDGLPRAQILWREFSTTVKVETGSDLSSANAKMSLGKKGLHFVGRDSEYYDVLWLTK